MDKPVIPSEVRTVYTGRIFSVHVESITLPNGRRLDAEIVRHPGSVVIVPVNDKGEVVLVRQYRPAIGRWLWELPAGSLEPGENIESAAIRECHEEIGLIPARVERLGALVPTPGYCDEEMTFCLAMNLRAPGRADKPAQPDDDEDIETKAFTRAMIWSMIASGEITDLKTVAGLALVERETRSSPS